MKKIHRFLYLSPVEKVLFLQAFLLLALIKLGLWGLPFQTLLKGVEWLAKRPVSKSALLSQNHFDAQFNINSCVRAINLSTRYMPGGAKCLARALVGQVLLRRRGHPTELRIGVKKGAHNQLEAHAWIELDHQVIIGQVSELDRFRPLPGLTPTMRLN